MGYQLSFGRTWTRSKAKDTHPSSRSSGTETKRVILLV